MYTQCTQNRQLYPTNYPQITDLTDTANYRQFTNAANGQTKNIVTNPQIFTYCAQLC